MPSKEMTTTRERMAGTPMNGGSEWPDSEGRGRTAQTTARQLGKQKEKATTTA
jgi:hypothetical protein